MLLSDKEAQCRGRVSLPFSIRAKQANLLRFRGYLRTAPAALGCGRSYLRAGDTFRKCSKLVGVTLV